MKSKRKLIIAISSLIATFSIALVAVVAIFAAQNQSVQSSLTIRYTAIDVSATVRANYIIGGTTSAMLTDEGEEELVFLPTSEEGGSLTPQDDNIELNSTDNSVIFEYVFTNDSNTIDVMIDLDTTAFSVNNMTVEYAYSYERIENTAVMQTTSSFEPMMILGEEKEGGQYETLYVYVKAKISNLANDASFEGNMDFSLTRATPVKLSFENIEGVNNSRLLRTRIIPANTPIGSLPTPKFADGEEYTWFNESSLETLVSYPFMASEDMVVFCGLAPYLATVMENGTTIIENVSEEPIYIATKTNGTFKFGVSEYINTDGAYILVDEGQNVTVTTGSGVSNVNFASPVSDTNAVKNVSLEAPEDLEEKKFYGAYGAYPQTYVGNAMNETLKNATLTPTGKSYTTDINGMETVLTEYSYGGKKYAKFESSKYSYDAPTFSTGEIVENDKTYFFHVEPIVAEAKQKNVDGTYTMMTVNLLGSKAFNLEGGSDNSWQNSDLRAYLNNEFMNESGLSSVVVEQSITNTDYYGHSPVSGNTTDKIWLASVEEILNWSGSGDGLDSFIEDYYISDGNDALREKKPSDMLLVTYFDTYGGGCYYLRSAGCEYNVGHPSICLVTQGGVPDASAALTITDIGFCPVFAVNV